MNFSKTIIAPLAIMTLTTSLPTMAVDYDKLHQQLAIMSDILTTSIKSQNTTKGPRISRIESQYLAGQGVVFNLSSSRVSHYSILESVHMPDVPRAPRAPRAVEGVEHTELFGEDFELVIEEAMEEAAIAIEIVNEQARDNIEQQQEMREQERELAYELRDIAREERDLNYQKLHSEKDEHAELEAEAKELNQRKAKLEKMRVDVKRRAAEHRKLREKAAKEKKQQQQTFFANVETSIASALCSYGAGLKELPDEERISMVLKSAGEMSGNRIKDKVLIFNKSDIKDCVIEKIDSKGLLAKANGYQF